MRRAACIAACCLLALARPAAAICADGFTPAAADISAAQLLATARGALRALDGELAEVDRSVQYNTALSALTGLYQLHGCQWALPQLQQLGRRPDASGMHCGYSADGRVLVYLEPLALRNPAFQDYTIFLCTLESHTAVALAGETTGTLRLHLSDGTELAAQPLTVKHPLYGHLDRLAESFTPPAVLPAGAGIAFKQIFAASAADTQSITAVSLTWGKYRIDVPYFVTEVDRK